jgi:hypothetical protein
MGCEDGADRYVVLEPGDGATSVGCREDDVGSIEKRRNVIEDPDITIDNNYTARLHGRSNHCWNTISEPDSLSVVDMMNKFINPKTYRFCPGVTLKFFVYCGTTFCMQVVLNRYISRNVDCSPLTVTDGKAHQVNALTAQGTQ